MEYHRVSGYPMRSHFRILMFAACIVAACAEIASAQTPAPATPAQTTPATTPAQTAPATTPVPRPAIAAISPAAPLIAPNQAVVLTGSNFQKDLIVTFTDPEGYTYPGAVQSVPDSGQAVVIGTLGIGGTWKVTAKNPDGPASDPKEFAVANSTPLSYASPGLYAFLLSALVATGLIVGLLWFVLVDLGAAQNTGKWSFGDALSEESVYQPKEITKKSDVITFASTSRLIALLGLIGILGVVVGVGYSIMWNLYIYGTVPDLREVRSFLLGAATLFAPYLANQISGIFAPGGKKQSDAGPAVPTVAGIAPASPSIAPAAQSLHVIGTGFMSGASLTFTDPAGNAVSVSGAAVTAVAPALISCSVALNTAGSWKVAIANPSGPSSDAFIFTVPGPPTITAMSPSAPVHNATAQTLTLNGTGFMSGLTVALTSSAGAAAVTIAPDSVTATSVVIRATLDVAGNWQAVVTNPGAFASAAFPFTVT